jgi:antitoxin (DNA-binding transcriptional repressor) of toxin-antitoxin stability system
VDTISKNQLKARMLEIFREIEETGRELIVTDRGRPVLRIEPVGRGCSVDIAFAGIQRQVVYHEDPDTPTAAEWSET